jgi:asparagine synthase (glutamine-hydrolysing)
MAMAHSVEGRYPFLDYRVVEFCGRLPDDLKQRGLTEKWLLKRLARRIIPEEIWRRVKRPYRAPIRRTFFSGDHRPDYIDELLSPESLRRTEYFRPGAVTGLVNKARTRDDLSEMDEMALVGILSTQLVDHLYLRQRPLLVETGQLPRLKIVDAARNSILI